MSYGHDYPLGTAGLCGCSGCQAGLASDITDGRQALSGTQSSGSDSVDALVVGLTSKWGSSALMGRAVNVTYSFMTSNPSYNSGDSSFAEFNSDMKAAARSALATWSSVSEITFTEVADTGDGGSIRFGSNAQYDTAGYAYYPSTSAIGGDVWISNSYSYNTTPVAGDYGYLVYLHEIGHAIGLKHPGDYNAGGGGTDGPFLSSADDNTDNTVMSYTTGSTVYPTTIGPYDILAIRYLYGYSGTGTIGNVTFGSDAAESFTGDSGIQYVYGRDGADYIDVQGGNDGVVAGSGIDTVFGGSGDDIIYGNIGADLLSGGAGNDTIFGGQNDGPESSGSDGVLKYRSGVETVDGGDGNDVLYGNYGFDLLRGGNGNDLIFAGQDEDTVSGGAGNDTIYGNKGDDLLIGGDGYDRFTFVSDNGNDTVSDFTYYTDYLVIQNNINGSGITSFATLVAHATQVGSDVVIDLGSGNSITLSNYATGSLISADVLII